MRALRAAEQTAVVNFFFALLFFFVDGFVLTIHHDPPGDVGGIDLKLV